MNPRPPVAIAHDYLTQRGGAERVVLSLTRAFPDAEVVTSFYEPSGTFPDFAGVRVRTAPIDRVAPLRHHHRLALPLLAPTFSRLVVDADVTVCNTSGWAHGVQATGAKIVMCHAPARWLYQRDTYTAESSLPTRTALAALHGPLRRWDQAAARSADLYLANSSRARQLVRDAYGFDVEVLHPPHSIDPDGPREPMAGLEPGYLLCVARLLPYKFVDRAIAAVAERPSERLVVVGRGPDEARLRALAGPNVTFLAEVSDAELRWLYANAEALIALGIEDFGLTPVEAAVFATPSIVTPFGGYLDTVTDGVNGVHLDDSDASPASVLQALDRLRSLDLDPTAVRASTEPFSEAVFSERIHGYVATVAQAT
jgi:glycosyltransferase involved in cell wall biosynthesis